jgi:hypothetical protein
MAHTAVVEEREQQQEEDVRTVEDIPGGVLKALHAHAAQERGRYSLNCIHLQGREVIAANGAVLARVILPEDMGPESLYEFPKPHLRKRKPAKLIRRNGELRAEQTDGSSVRVETFQSPGQDGRWPEHYQEVIPPEEEGTQIKVNLGYLRKALDLLDCAGYESVRLTVTDNPAKPFRLDGVKTDRYGNRTDHRLGVTVVVSPIVAEDPDEQERGRYSGQR